jgi:hypothetical protein
MPGFGMLQMANAADAADGEGNRRRSVMPQSTEAMEAELHALDKETLKQESKVKKKWDTWNKGRANGDAFSQRNKLLQYWIEFADALHSRVTSTHHFEAFFQSCIGVMCLLMGLETYDYYEKDATIEVCMGILICFFSIEVILKIMAESIKPWRYFGGPNGRWNTMDLLIVILCLPFLPVGDAGRLLRMFRLVRLGKIIAKIPSFRVFVIGIEESIGDIVNISALIAFILYMYSVAGMVLFKGNDPWHFGTLDRSFITLFSVATMDGWASIMLKNMHGCGMYAESVADGSLDPNVYECTESVSQPYVGSLFFMSFVTVTGLVMISMFIGVISIAMSGTIYTQTIYIVRTLLYTILIRETTDAIIHDTYRRYSPCDYGHAPQERLWRCAKKRSTNNGAY